jgi:hypothetical protein
LQGMATLHPYEGCQEGRSDFARFVLVRLASCGAQRTRSGVTRGSGGINHSLPRGFSTMAQPKLPLQGSFSFLFKAKGFCRAACEGSCRPVLPP